MMENKKDTYDNENGNNDGNAFNPIDWGLTIRSFCAEILEETESERNDSSNR